MRRETYATSGPRMIVRFFGGYDFTQADATRTPSVAGYAKGVPMGADLPAAPACKTPTFLVAALKDRFSGNLDRIQIPTNIAPCSSQRRVILWWAVCSSRTEAAWISG